MAAARRPTRRPRTVSRRRDRTLVWLTVLLISLGLVVVALVVIVVTGRDVTVERQVVGPRGEELTYEIPEKPDEHDRDAGGEAPEPPRSPAPDVGETVPQPRGLPRLGEEQNQFPEEQVQAGDIIPWDRAVGHIGQVVTIEGRVVQTKAGGELTFLNFTHDRQPGTFYVAVHESVEEALPEPAERYYARRTVQVTGEVELYQGRDPRIEVRRPDQIQIVE